MAVALVDIAIFHEGAEISDPFESFELVGIVYFSECDCSYDLEPVRCSDEDLGLAPGTPKFYPINEESEYDLKLIHEKSGFVCFDLGEFELFGNWRTTYNMELLIKVNHKTEIEGACMKSPEESFFCELPPNVQREANTLKIVTLTNQKRYLLESYDMTSPIHYES